VVELDHYAAMVFRALETMMRNRRDLVIAPIFLARAMTWQRCIYRIATTPRIVGCNTQKYEAVESGTTTQL
jgi:hypothetical protein